jgi:hypothetical protein
VTINGYSSMPGRMSHTETTVLTEDKGEWKAAREKLVHAKAGALRYEEAVVDARNCAVAAEDGLSSQEAVSSPAKAT